jgi:uncharacterized protein (TIGR02466 family)
LKALERAPDMTEAHYNLGIALQELGDYSQANSHYDKVLDAEPSHAAAALNIAYGLQQMGQLDQAVDGLERTLEIDPDFAKAAVNLADLRLQQGKPEEALKVCDSYLAKHPSSPDLLAFRAMALCDLGETKVAEKLMDFDRLVKPVTIQPPSGYSDMEAFNAALVDHVVTHPTLTFAPQSHATREGRHSGELLAEPKGPIAGLEQAIWQAAQQYRAEQGQDTDHPFLSSPPEKLTLSVWGVVMQSAGHQIPHIHPAAWLSGVYYASVPDIVEHDRDDHAGWIAFGKPPDHFHNKSTQRVEFVKPAPGRMVLFPSYFYHHAVPFEAEGLRVSIAFDLMPA